LEENINVSGRNSTGTKQQQLERLEIADDIVPNNTRARQLVAKFRL
jgi:hypothetical protein